MSKLKDESADPGTSTYQRLKKIAGQAKDLAAVKADNVVVRKEIETVFDTRGRPKYRQVLWMKDGKKYRRPIPASLAKK